MIRGIGLLGIILLFRFEGDVVVEEGKGMCMEFSFLLLIFMTFVGGSGRGGVCCCDGVIDFSEHLR